MKWAVRIARIAGIDLKLHVTFIIFLAWIALTYYWAGGRALAIEGTLFVVLLFLCVVLHEFGHALVARHFGIHTPDITLLPIGGVARLERIPDDPKQELLIAIAGPLVNVVIAVCLILFLSQGVAFSDLNDLNTPRVSLLTKLASVNIALVLFNLVPAFPMDGGRVLRALLAMRMKYSRATQIAANTGQVLAFVFGLVGLFYNPLLILIAFFVYIGAAQEAAMAQIKEITADLPVSEAMVTHVEPLSAKTKVGVVAESVLRTPHRVFPVLDEDRVVGAVARDQILEALRRGRVNTLLSELMQGDLPILGPDDRLDQAFLKMQQFGYPALPVIDSSGQLVGLVTTEAVSELIVMRSYRGMDERASPRPAHARHS